MTTCLSNNLMVEGVVDRVAGMAGCTWSERFRLLSCIPLFAHQLSWVVLVCVLWPCLLPDSQEHSYGYSKVSQGWDRGACV